MKVIKKCAGFAKERPVAVGVSAVAVLLSVVIHETGYLLGVLVDVCKDLK